MFRVFGTFQEEKPNEEIVYGLVDQPRFFNIIKHQFFYFPLLHNKTDSKCSWSDNVKKYLFGPGWFPNMNLPRLGAEMSKLSVLTNHKQFNEIGKKSDVLHR